MYSIRTHDTQTVAIGSDFPVDLRELLVPHLGDGRVLLITGKHSFTSSEQAPLLTELLAAHDASVVHTLTVGENPDEAQLLEALDSIPAFDLILAVGGGSVIDAAKRIKHEYGKETSFAAIYTRFGSGTITTPFFVYDNHEFKIGGYDPDTIPSPVYVSLELMESLSTRQRVIGVADVLAHASESFLSTAGDASLTARARAVVEQLAPDAPEWPLERLVELDIEAGLIEGQCLVLLPHALGHYLTYTRGVPHGLASIVTLPAFIAYCNERGVIEPELGIHISNLAASLLQRCPDIDAAALQQTLIQELDEALPLIERYMPFVFESNPIPLTREEIRQLLTT